MLTGFYIYNREAGEEEIVYWERISKLSHYHWMFCFSKEDSTAPGVCLVFTYEKR